MSYENKKKKKSAKVMFTSENISANVSDTKSQQM